ncbi:MAG: glycoside hydrolase family 16 protein [Bacteroidia bacterium]
MSKRFLILIAAFSWLSVLSQTPATDPNFHLVWSDDFSNTNVANPSIPDPSKWTVPDYNDGFIATNSQLPGSNYTGYAGAINITDNVSVSGGVLTIATKKQNYSCPNSAVGQYQCSAEWAAQLAGQSYQYQYTSGGVQALYYPQYGYVEAKIKFDAVNYANYHPGFVLYGQNYPYSYPAAQEIDIFEFTPKISNTIYASTMQRTNIHLHYYTGTDCANNGDCGHTSCPCDDYFNGTPVDFHCSSEPCYGSYNILSTPCSNWHVYGLEWTPKQIIWYVDGVVVRNSVNPGINSYPSNINIGSMVDTSNAIDNSISQVNMYVDYVNVYQFNPDCNGVINSCGYLFTTNDAVVKKSIAIGCSGYTNGTAGTGVVSLWASDYIKLSGNFSVPLGATFFAGTNDYCDPVLNPVNPIAGCSTSFEACTTNNFLGLNNQTFKDIDIGGTGCTVNITPTSGANQLLHASDKIILEQGVHIQATSSNKVELKITSCP